VEQAVRLGDLPRSVKVERAGQDKAKVQKVSEVGTGGRRVARIAAATKRAHPRERVIHLGNHTNGRRQEFFIHVACGGVTGRGDDSDRPNVSVTARYVRAK
jgi:hypothetical protein